SQGRGALQCDRGIVDAAFKSFWVARDNYLNALFAHCANGRTGVRPSHAAAKLVAYQHCSRQS
ncbi:MAG: hypothetical protein IJU61_11600, partial [Victivallales bacterium]|nr:hypothetical protein [Victivallales bacterium]